MSDTSQETKKVILPRLKDKVMYVSTDDSTTKSETSYVISSSFKGILRLSPNNHNTTYEKPNIQLSLSDEKNLGTTYTDAIKFDSDTETAIKSEADITKRMIISSDSDGYVLGFRISENNFEFDKLGIIGVIEANHLSIISAAPSTNEDVLILNNQRMPHTPNKVQEAVNVETFSDIGCKNPIQPYDYHTKDVKITGNGDKSFLLFSQVTGDNKRFYKYQRTHYLIRELILEALMDFQTIPTGSIHWFPVTLEQFKTLVKANGQKPNVSFNGDKQVDPLLRDFLLCDGRRYNNKDFPELAKILWKEPIRRWRKVHINTAEYCLPVMDEKCNVYGKIKDDKGEYIKNDDGSEYERNFTFRVPDLRHQFISSTYTDGSLCVASGKPSDGVKGTKNKVGSWCPDNTPPSSMEFREDRHAHLVAYGSYGKNRNGNGYKAYTTDNKGLWGNIEITPDISFQKDLSKLHVLHNLSTPHVTLLHNHPYRLKINGDDFRGFGWRYNSPTARKHSGVDSIPCTMWLSRPDVTDTSSTGTNVTGFREWRPDTIERGMSSPDVTSTLYPKNYVDIDEEFNGSIKWNEKYVDWGNYQNSLYSHESTPKYYAMLPFIKI